MLSETILLGYIIFTLGVEHHKFKVWLLGLTYAILEEIIKQYIIINIENN